MKKKKIEAKKEHKANHSVDVRVYQLPTPHFHIIGIYLNDVTLCIPNETAKMKQHHTEISANNNTIFRTMSMEHGEHQKKKKINIIITIMGKNIKFQFTLPYKRCFYVNYLAAFDTINIRDTTSTCSQAVVLYR